MKEKLAGSNRKTALKRNNFKKYKNQRKTISYKTAQRHLKTTKFGKIAYKQLSKPLFSRKTSKTKLNFANMSKNQAIWGKKGLARAGGSHPLDIRVPGGNLFKMCQADYTAEKKMFQQISSRNSH